MSADTVVNVAPEEVIQKAVEAVAEPDAKKSSWMGSMFKWLSYIFVFWVFLLAI